MALPGFNAEASLGRRKRFYATPSGTQITHHNSGIFVEPSQGGCSCGIRGQACTVIADGCERGTHYAKCSGPSCSSCTCIPYD